MGWLSRDELHEAYVVPIFDGGDRSLGTLQAGPDGTWEVRVERVEGAQAVAEAEKDAAAGAHVGQRRFQRVDDSDTLGEWVRPAGAATGWQLMCDCSKPSSWTPTTWEGPVITRVPSKALERLDLNDPEGMAWYATDEDVPDAGDDHEDLVLELWNRHHLFASERTGAIQTASHELRAAERRLDQAVADARSAGVSWESIGRAAGLTKQAAHGRWRIIDTATTRKDNR